MGNESAVLDFIERFESALPPGIAGQLREAIPLTLITGIMEAGQKTASEAVLVAIYSVTYLSADARALWRLGTEGGLAGFIDGRMAEMLELGCRRKVQGNLAERGLPVLEVLARKIPGSAPTVVELGSSFGLIGYCLTGAAQVAVELSGLLAPGQQMPAEALAAHSYLGIDLDPPDRDWLLACTYEPGYVDRIRRLLDQVELHGRHRVIKGSALGFAGLPEVRALLGEGRRVVVLTSFMMYQLPPAARLALRDQIVAYCRENAADWLNQDVDVAVDGPGRYYVEWNGERVIHLADDRCSSWVWQSA